jgi:hypothetical protein
MLNNLDATTRLEIVLKVLDLTNAVVLVRSSRGRGKQLDTEELVGAARQIGG